MDIDKEHLTSRNERITALFIQGYGAESIAHTCSIPLRDVRNALRDTFGDYIAISAPLRLALNPEFIADNRPTARLANHYKCNAKTISAARDVIKYMARIEALMTTR